MAIQFYPQPGTILICDFAGFVEPEMVKRRPVIVIGPRLRNRGNLVNIVPLSTARPGEMCPYHYKLHTGECVEDAQTSVAVYPVKSCNGKVWVCAGED